MTTKEIKEKIKSLPTTRPEYESDMYDKGLNDMKEQVLAILDEKEK